MRLLGLVLAAISLSAAAPPPDLQPFEKTLAGSDFGAAAAFVDKLIVQRAPTDGVPRPDPFLNALMGRLYLAAHNPTAAAIYLDHANLEMLPSTLRRPTALAHGQALELLGRRAAALAAYRAAAAEGPDDAEHQRAVIGEARKLLPDDPALARQLLLGISEGPPNAERWNAEYMLAALNSLAGDSSSAHKLADQAWTDALNAGVNDLAPLHVAALRAGLAAAAHDLVAERTMLIAANGLSVSAGDDLSSQLPVCGDGGLKPSDYVVFAFVAGPYLTHELIPVAASRSAAISPFYDALLPITPIKLGVEPDPVGTVFTVSCRTVVNSNLSDEPNRADPLLEWFVERGMYPASTTNEDEDPQVNAVADRIQAIEQRFGKDSPLLIGPRWQMILLLEKRAQAGESVSSGQVADLSTAVAAGMRRAGAPEWMAKMFEFRLTMEQAAAQGEDSLNAPAMRALAREELLQAPFPIGRELLLNMVSNFKQEWPTEVAQLFLDLDRHRPPSLAGRARQAWLLSVAHAQKLLKGRPAAQATLAAADLPRDLCVVADEDLTLLDQHFSYSDYPHQLQVGDQEGAVLFDFDLSPTGSVSGHRIVYSLPSNLFDEASAKGLSTVRYTAPRMSGRVAGCRGLFQPIIWRLESNDNFSIPTFTSEASGPTT